MDLNLIDVHKLSPVPTQRTTRFALALRRTFLALGAIAIALGLALSSSSAQHSLFILTRTIGEPWCRRSTLRGEIESWPAPYQRPYLEISPTLPSRLPGLDFIPNRPPHCFAFDCYRVNSLGYKGRDWTISEAPGAPSRLQPSHTTDERILILGDSMTYGFSEGELHVIEYPAQLEEILQASHSAKRQLVFNLAVPCYAPTQELGTLRHFYSAIRPTIVILGLFSANDNTPGEGFYANTVFNRFPSDPIERVDSRPITAITAADVTALQLRVTSFYSATLRDIAAGFYHRRLLPALGQIHDYLLQPDNGLGAHSRLLDWLQSVTVPRIVTFKSTIAPVLAIGEMRRFCASRGVRFYVVSLPLVFRASSAGALSFQADSNGLVEALRAYDGQIPIIELSTSDLNGIDLERLVLGNYDLTNPDRFDFHLSTFGHRVIAERIANALSLERF